VLSVNCEIMSLNNDDAVTFYSTAGTVHIVLEYYCSRLYSTVFGNSNGTLFRPLLSAIPDLATGACVLCHLLSLSQGSRRFFSPTARPPSARLVSIVLDHSSLPVQFTPHLNDSSLLLLDGHSLCVGSLSFVQSPIKSQ
jgi:hypothetical protein